MPPGQSVLLHLLPGAVAAAVYFALVPVAAHLSLPTAAALGASGLLAVAPAQLALLSWYAGRRKEAGIRAVVVFRNRLRWSVTIAWAVGLFVVAAAVFLLSRPMTEGLQRTLFGWWPACWQVDLGVTGGHPAAALWLTAGILMVGTVVVAPFIEEIYFRGFLLPRMPERLGRLAPAVHAALFGLYHLWTPWLMPARFLAIVPLSYVVSHTKSVRISIIAHVLANATDLVVLLAYLARN